MSGYPKKEITLTRLGKKLWQYKDNTPKRVELAVLDYYRANGWHGYSTDGPSYFSILHILMAIPSLDLSSLKRFSSLDELMLFGGEDGLRTHPYSFEEVVRTSNERCLTENCLREVLEASEKAGIRSRPFWAGSQYINVSEICSLYKAFGKVRLNQKLLEMYPECRRLTTTIVSTLDREYPKGKYERFWAKGNFGRTLCMHMSVFNPQQFKKRPEDNHLTKLRAVALSGNSRLHQELIEDIRVIDKYLRWKEKYSELIHYLDLVLWSDSGDLAFVEVKAPNDYLAPHQTKRIKRHIHDGEEVWVLNVNEA